MNELVQILPIVLILIVFYLLVLRPARKRQRDFMDIQRGLEPGSRVMLSSGIHGELVTVGDDTVQLRIAPDVVIEVARQAVAKVVTPQAPLDEPVEED